MKAKKETKLRIKTENESSRNTLRVPHKKI